MVMRLGNFITENMEQILQAWEAFAKTIVPPALSMDSKELRDHAKLMLEAIALDLSKEQSSEAQHKKSLGEGRLLHEESAAEVHASGRLFSGFTMDQLLSEYRALRASVLSLWAAHSKTGLVTDPDDVMRFNEGIDQAIAESVARYSQMISKSQHLFLAILGHDLRNPLATTMMASSFIMRSPEADEKLATAATRIYNAGQRMNTLVNDLIDYTRTNLGSNLPIILKEANLESLCTEAIAEQQLANPQRQFQLVAKGEFQGRWDDNRIAQVLSNLLGNAVQHGSPKDPIILRLRENEQEVGFSVESRGKTIPEAKLGSIFEPLVRLAAEEGTDTAHHTSLGIGLHISREIVLAHGGTISVSSTDQDGTIFTVTLPRHSNGDVKQQWMTPAR